MISAATRFPKIMGIVNVTSDSFSDGGKYFSPEAAIAHASALVRGGADIIDVGGESTRPGADPVPEHVEFERVIPVIEAIKKQHPTTTISVDTTKYRVASAALEAGATIINDVSGLEMEPRFSDLAASKAAGLIIMHRKGTPKTMQQNPHYDNVIQEVYNSLASKIELARSSGVRRIYADVGIGFGKNLEHNLLLLKHIHSFSKLGVPLVLGISRKKFIDDILSLPNPEHRDVPTTMIHLLLLSSPAEIVRVHNVALLNVARRLFNAIY